MSELILKEDALNCFHDWIDKYGYEHTADEDIVYQKIAGLKNIEDCDDAISRRVAIEAIDEWFKKVHSYMSAYEYDSAYAQGEIDAYVTAIDTLKILPAVKPEPKWISCDERLPKEKQSVLVTDGSVMWVCDIINTDKGYKWEDSHGYWLDLDEWTAWMHLPKPYKKKSGVRCDER